MPEELTENVVALIAYLVPGFVAAWVLYGFTSHPKPSQFERIVQAIIYTVLIQAVLPVVRWGLLLIGDLITLGPWTDTGERATSVVLAIALGITLAYCTNTDALHGLLRKIRLTNRTSHPSEWFYIFSQKVTFVILHMTDGRRLYGWPKEWPIEPNKGQFYIMLPSWLMEDGTQIELPQLDGILIKAEDVAWVEFLRTVETVQ